MAQVEENPTITRKMTIQEILSLFPHKAHKLQQLISGAGLHCIGCHAATYETLEAGMYSHGFGEAEIEKLLQQLNGLLSQEEEAACQASSTITMTAKAAEKFLQFCQEEGKQGWALRFGDKLEGCSGFVYELDFSPKASANDRVFVSHGIEIHVSDECVDRLLGSVIDYVEGLHTQGFKVENPNAATGCGCGSSHNYGNSQATPKKAQGCCSGH